jgi:multidrug efflux pump subunit AcrA (membrane-fusion protein)
MRYFSILLFIFFVSSCGNNTTDETKEDTPQEVQTPVTIAHISVDTIGDFIELNAISSFLLKNFVKANATGYVEAAQILPGQFVQSGQILFHIKTKESVSIGNEINKLDSSFKFSGTNTIKAGTNGYISQLNHQSGDYVQDGEQLAVISDQNSFVFLLELPFELGRDAHVGTSLQLELPDKQIIPGIISSMMPMVDPAAQTQNVVIKVKTDRKIPENLIAKVRITKTLHSHAISLPAAAVLSNETQSDFWVMKMKDSITAVRVSVTKGLQNKDKVEILSPVFTSADQFVLTGNYGLGDTAKVRIVQ